MKQHIDSFNYFINVDIKNIIKANAFITSETMSSSVNDPDNHFYLKFTDINIGEPIVRETDYKTHPIMPQECRIRDMTYSGPIYVDLEYTKAKDTGYGTQMQVKKDVLIGYMPIMLGSSKCWLRDMDHR